MSAPQSLLQAAVNRLSARLASGLADTAASVSLLAQDAPDRLRQELQLFWQEVEQEAARLEREGPGPDPAASPFTAPSAGPGSSGATSSGTSSGSSGSAADPQEMIDALRAQVAGLAQRLDMPPSASGAAGAGQAVTPAPGRGA